MSLHIYEQYGFKFFPCKHDKTPDVAGSWQDSACHITIEQAEEIQSMGRMVGAWIPDGVIVIDLDKHEGKPDGTKTFKELKETYDIHTAFNDETFSVRTPSGGYHLFFITDNEYTQNNKAPGVDLKTHKGYVIAAGSPGYTANFDDVEPMELPEKLALWLDSFERQKGKKKEKTAPEMMEYSEPSLSVKKLRNILDNVDVTNYRDNDRWLSFIMSAMSVAGTSQEVCDALEEWSAKDPKYNDDRTIEKRIKSFDEIKEYTAGTFIYHLRNEKISAYHIKEIKKLQSSAEIIDNAQKQESELPFNGIDYDVLSHTPEASEFFTLQGHTNAAKVLFNALRNTVIYVEGEKRSYYFDGNRWVELFDPYSVIYTILFRVGIKVFYQGNEKYDNNECIKGIVKNINALFWKESVWKELTHMDGIFHKSVEWDSPKNRETLTCVDGIIDFSGDKVVKRNGTLEEYRRYFVNYTCDEIAGAETPVKFLEFLQGIIPDNETLETLEYYISCMISGNASKRIFSIWKGSGKNGKSTLQEILRNVVGHKLITTFDVGLILQTREGATLGPTPEQAKLQGTLAAFTSEVDAHQKLNTTKIKNLCGDETITANPKHRDPIEFEATWQMVLLCNDFPRFNASDNALIDRLLIIPFDMKYVKNESEVNDWVRKGVKRKHIKLAAQKKKFVPDILRERAGILRWMIEKYIELENKHDGIIPESELCERLKNRYVKENDDFGLFVDKFCIVDTEAEFYTSNNELAEKYREFMDNKKLSVQYITNGIIKATNEVVEKAVKRVETVDEFGQLEKKPQRVLLHIKIDEMKFESPGQDIRASGKVKDSKEPAGKDGELNIPF